MFDINLYRDCESYFQFEHGSSFELISGSGRVLISAPHSVRQTRNGEIKYSEPQSGALAKMLHLTTGCPVIFKTRNCNDDANYDERSPYKDALAEYVSKNNISLVLDLHQLAKTRDMDVNIGTGRMSNVKNEAYLENAVNSFMEQGITSILIDKPFEASFPFTVSSFIASKTDATCLQIEINSRLLQGEFCEDDLKKVYLSLINTIKKCNQ